MTVLRHHQVAFRALDQIDKKHCYQRNNGNAIDCLDNLVPFRFGGAGSYGYRNIDTQYSNPPDSRLAKCFNQGIVPDILGFACSYLQPVNQFVNQITQKQSGKNNQKNFYRPKVTVTCYTDQPVFKTFNHYWFLHYRTKACQPY